MKLGKQAIIEEMRRGNIKFEPRVPEEHIDGVTVDLTLSNRFLVFRPRWWEFWKWFVNPTIRIDEHTDVKRHAREITLQPGEVLRIRPHELVIGFTHEAITLPNLNAEISTRSRHARVGLSVHSSANIIHPGVYESHTALEIKNNNSIYAQGLVAGERICQVAFSRVEGETTYEGRHVTQALPTGGRRPRRS